jgi:hypothetical protein
MLEYLGTALQAILTINTPVWWGDTPLSTVYLYSTKLDLIEIGILDAYEVLLAHPSYWGFREQMYDRV